MAGSKSEGKGWRPGGGGEPVRRGAKPEWIPTTEKPKRGTRRIKQLALVLLGLAIIGTGVWLYYLHIIHCVAVSFIFII